MNLTGRDRGADDVIAYHLRQAFKPGEVTPEEANQIGRELALKLTKGNHAFVVCTHVDKHHVHNHIIINSTALDCTRKFRNFWGSTWAIRRMNDKLCLEHGLSIVENPKPSRDHYGTWLGNTKQPSFQEQLRRAIDAALEERPKDFEDFLKKLEAAGIEVNRERKNLRLRGGAEKLYPVQYAERRLYRAGDTGTDRGHPHGKTPPYFFRKSPFQRLGCWWILRQRSGPARDRAMNAGRRYLT